MLQSWRQAVRMTSLAWWYHMLLEVATVTKYLQMILGLKRHCECINLLIAYVLIASSCEHVPCRCVLGFAVIGNLERTRCVHFHVCSQLKDSLFQWCGVLEFEMMYEIAMIWFVLLQHDSGMHAASVILVVEMSCYPSFEFNLELIEHGRSCSIISAALTMVDFDCNIVCNWWKAIAFWWIYILAIWTSTCKIDAFDLQTG